MLKFCRVKLFSFILSLYILFIGSLYCMANEEHIDLQFWIWRRPYLLEQTDIDESDALKKISKYLTPIKFIVEKNIDQVFEDFKTEKWNPLIGKEIYIASFANEKEMIEAIKQLPTCPSLSFYGGLTAKLIERFVDYTINSNNVELMKMLILKNDKNCPNEEIFKILDKLKQNEKLYQEACSLIKNKKNH